MHTLITRGFSKGVFERRTSTGSEIFFILNKLTITNLYF